MLARRFANEDRKEVVERTTLKGDGVGGEFGKQVGH